MTINEFKAWLGGYMLNRENPDIEVIVAKVNELEESPISPARSLPGTIFGPSESTFPLIPLIQPQGNERYDV